MASEGGSRLVPQMQANFLVQGGEAAIISTATWFPSLEAVETRS